MGKVRAVLLDVDGTLLDSNDLHAEAWHDALTDHGFDMPIERIRPLIGMGSDKVVPELTGLAEESPEGKAISEHRKKIFAERYLPQVRPFACARDLLERMRSDGYRLVVATSAGREELEGLLERGGIEDLLPDRTSSDDADHSKPAPDIVQAALGKAGCSANEAIMLGDTPYDVRAAREAGLAIIALRCGGWDEPALEGAAALYRDPAELLDRYDTSPLGAG